MKTPTLSPADVMAPWRAAYPDALIVINDGGPRRLVGWPPNDTRPAGQVEDVPPAYAAHAVIIAHKSLCPVRYVRVKPEARS